MDRAFVDELLARINTEPLRQPDTATVALVVFNPTEMVVPPCRVRFGAAFLTGAAKPVTVRDDHGSIVPSHIVHETITTDAPDLPPGKVLWSLVLEFALPDGLPSRIARAFAAAYETPPALTHTFNHLPLRLDLPVYETACHPGDLPTAFPLPPFGMGL
ncbi:MAG: hypothetical protein H8F28_15180 [Fibrella sp.]|nr:hypothetical protein [Armatimonadota bacterium]